MSAPHCLILPVAGAATADFDATECDKITVLASNAAPGAGEKISIYFVTTNNAAAVGGVGPNGTVPVYSGTTALAITNTAPFSLSLEGGFLYRIVKDANAGTPVGVDIAIKRAQGA